MAIFSDDFSDGVIDPRWIEGDPLDIATWTESGGMLNVATSAGGDAYNAPAGNSRMLQSHGDTDFDIAAKWTLPSEHSEGAGLWADDGTDNEYIRVDIRLDSTAARTWIAHRVGGVYTNIANTLLGLMNPTFPSGYLWIRLARVGTQCTFYWRNVDGGEWTTVATWTSAVNATRVGLSFIRPNPSQGNVYEFVNLAAPAVPTVTLWDGSAEVPATLSRWDGLQEVPSAIEIT